MSLGTQLARERAQRQLSQQGMGKLLGVSKDKYHAFEHDRRLPKMERFAEWCVILERYPCELLDIPCPSTGLRVRIRELQSEVNAAGRQLERIERHEVKSQRAGR